MLRVRLLRCSAPHPCWEATLASAIAVALPDASVAQAKIVAITRNVFFFIYMSFRQVDVTSVESRSVFAIVIECCHLLGGRVALNIQTGDIAVVRNRIA